MVPSDLMPSENVGDTKDSGELESDFSDFCATDPFLLALRALRSVACVSLRKTRSNSSLYPGHCLRDLAH